MNKLEDARKQSIDDNILKIIGKFNPVPESIKEHRIKAHIDYCYSKEFKDRYDELRLQEQHPALNDLYQQYQMMLALLREGQND